MKSKSLIGLLYKAGLSWSQNRLAFIFFLILALSFSASAQNLTVVPTIAALRALNTTGFTNDTVAYVIDYYSISQLAARGGGHFRWLTPYSSIYLCCGNVATDDGGRFIASSSNTNGLWERVFDGGTPNVKMWGAYGDGVHDDTLAIQAAVNGVGQWGDGSLVSDGELFFPAGTYNITNTIIFNAAIIHIRGEAPLTVSVLMQLGIGKDIFRTGNANSYLTGGSGGYDQGMIFENIGLKFADDGTGGSHPGRNLTNSCLVLGQTGEMSVIRNVHCFNGGYGIHCLGAGAPGLNLRDIKCDEPAIAGVYIEPLPGHTIDGGGPITIIGLSGDQSYSDVGPTASLLVVTNIGSEILVQSIKAEGDFGGGLVHYYCANNNGDSGHMSLKNCNYNAGPSPDGQFFSTDFLKIDPSSGFAGAGPVFTIEQVNLNAVSNLINDTICGRIVPSYVQIITGDYQLAAKQPITYQSNPTGAGDVTSTSQTTGSTLFIGDKAVTTFYATNAGWYRIMAPYGDGRGDMSGRVTVTSPYALENFELQIDASDTATPTISVSRCKSGIRSISQARVGSYFDTVRDGYYSFADIYVSNALSTYYGYDAPRITVSLDVSGVISPGGGYTQLLSPILPVCATVPSGANVVVTNVYR